LSGRLTDELAYNDKQWTSWVADEWSQLVGDIKLVCDVDQFSGTGGLEFRWEFRGRKVVTRISSAGQVELVLPGILRAAEDGQARDTVAQGRLPGPLSAAKQLTFAVRDGRTYVMQDDRLVVSAAVGPQDLATVKGRLARDDVPCRLEISASRCHATLSRIVLWKDIYYRNLEQFPGGGSEPGWGCTGHPIRLGEGEYFVLGDNSTRSKDSRFWGKVPADVVIGIARWTYWPPSRWHQFR